jgi:hypothetical protein
MLQDNAAKIRKGKMISLAREEGMELVDARRLANMLEDLMREQMLTLDDNSIRVAKRGIEILRG